MCSTWLCMNHVYFGTWIMSSDTYNFVVFQGIRLIFDANRAVDPVGDLPDEV